MQHQTEHYVFHYKEQSAAERDILEIASLQEGCFDFISGCLGAGISGRIHYHLFDTAEEVGAQYAIVYNCDNDRPCNGFALPSSRSEDGMEHVFAVYSDAVKCIGFHEDAHIISYSIGKPEPQFFREGLAMHFDRYWWGIDNHTWTRYYLERGEMPSIASILTREGFNSFDCMLTYPIAGAFTSYIIERYGMCRYLEFYKNCKSSPERTFEEAFGEPLEAIEQSFIRYISMFELREKLRELMKKDLEEE